MQPLFYYNGIKDHKGAELQKCWYSTGNLINYPQGTITIYAKNYSRFSKLVREHFRVENDTDIMTDYFDEDTIRVLPGHSLYDDVRQAALASDAKRQAVCDRRRERFQNLACA